MCPKCGGPVHRSRTRGLGEKVVKLLTANRTYRCFECGWRGWLQAADISQLRESRRRQLVRTIISVLLTILITALIALYLVRNSHACILPLPGSNVPAERVFDQDLWSSNGRVLDGSALALIRAGMFCKNRWPGRFFESRCSREAHSLLLRRHA